jgi:branched-chain amino acid aminotransferase
MRADGVNLLKFVVKKIMNECYGKKFILNGELYQSATFDISLVNEGESVYEVIRVVRGNPVFFDDHIERLKSSVRLQHKKMLADSETLRADIITLFKYDKHREVNLKIVFNFKKNEVNYLVYFIEPIYPSEEQYAKGVKGILFFAERKDPGSKVIDHKLRSSIFHKLIVTGGYEALLVNDEGMITEGSRSNIFFLRGNKLYTAPDDLILSGITRKHLIEICRSNKIEISFECVRADKISEYDAAFMTGTSPMVLPFSFIDETRFKVDIPVMKQLRKLYIDRVEESISVFRRRG